MLVLVAPYFCVKYPVFTCMLNKLSFNGTKKKFSFCFISPQNIFPVVVRFAKALFGKLQKCSNVFLESSSFLSGVLPWTPYLFKDLHIVDS